MSDHDTAAEQSNAIYLVLVPAGLMLGAGLVLVYYSFGWEAGPLNQDIAQAGFSGLDNLSGLWGINYSLGLIAAGLLLMVYLNANAWKSTGGY